MPELSLAWFDIYLSKLLGIYRDLDESGFVRSFFDYEPTA